jgi:hypothetical protein
MLDRFRRAAAGAGRAPESLGVEPILNIAQVPEASWPSFAAGWRALGATHLCIHTMGVGLKSAQEHIDVLRRVKDALGV